TIFLFGRSWQTVYWLLSGIMKPSPGLSSGCSRDTSSLDCCGDWATLRSRQPRKYVTEYMKRPTKPGYLLKHHIPVKTDSWDVKSAGFTEVDWVSHSGNSGEGERCSLAGLARGVSASLDLLATAAGLGGAGRGCGAGVDFSAEGGDR